ncbi:MAG: AEC family transporter [Ruminococcaceae bacterium]|nr:AEC family transporter [Oscillospiraceae bacterium]
MAENSAALVAQQVIILLFVMLCGIYARKRNFITASSTSNFSKVLLSVCQPCLIISSFQVDYTEALLSTGLKVTLVSAIMHFSLIVVCLFIFNFIKDNSQRKIYRFSTIFGNCGFLGFPVLNAMYGDVGIFYGAFFTLVFHVVVWSYGIFMLTAGTGKKRFDVHQLKNMINPGTVSTLVGVLLFAFQIKIPSPLIDGIDMVGDVTIPLSMLVVGALIANTNFSRIFKNVHMYCFCAIKLLILPFIAILICKLFNVDPTLLAPIAVIMTGTPAGTITASLAELYGEDAVLGSESVGISTILSIGSIPLMIYLANLIL